MNRGDCLSKVYNQKKKKCQIHGFCYIQYAYLEQYVTSKTYYPKGSSIFCVFIIGWLVKYIY